jgi:hypothetical protein
LAAIGELEMAVATATAKVAHIANQTADAQALADLRSKAVEKAIDALSPLNRAPLEKAQRAYDAAAAARQAYAIPQLEAERTLRGARQMLAEGLMSYRAQGEALANAVERARHGEVTPSLTDPLSCDGADCGRIDARTHAAMITIGAVAPTVQSENWPTAGRECDFVLLEPSFAKNRRVFTLTAAQKEAQSAAQHAAAAARVARQQHEAALQERAAAVGEATAETLKQLSGQVIALRVDLQRADAAADAAKARERETAETLKQYFSYWDALARAIVTTSYKDNPAISRNGLDAAALAVMGAHPTGKAKACLLQVGAGTQKTVAFAPVPAAKC